MVYFLFTESYKASEVSGTINRHRGSERQCESEEEGECDDPATHHLTEATTSATEWMGVTTNSDDECSYRYKQFISFD